MEHSAVDNCHYPFVYYKGVLASKPSTILSYQNNQLQILHNNEEYILQIPAKEALEFIEELNQKLELTTKTKHHYQYGFIGFFSFEFGLKLQQNKLDKTKLLTQKIPDFYFILPTQIDYLNQEFQVTESVKILHENQLQTTPKSRIPKEFAKKKFKSNLTEKQYLKNLDQIKELLLNGETYQVNFAQRWEGQTQLLAKDIFKQLEQLNPSPHSAILHTADFSIISNSPESLFIKTKNQLITNPIKGTIPKDKDPKTLLESKKDQAELEMIVDLERNDLGKIAKTGTVKVTKHRYLESYSNVHHTLSQIECELKPETKFSEIIQSIFPGGSITGCPKHRTSQIIHDLEPNIREYYCGSLGYLDTSGNAQFNILIRTVLLQEYQTYFHSGGGITIQSDPKSEFKETLHKAANIIKVLS